MKPYEEISFPSGYLRWIREGDEYVCRMSEGYMRKMKALHEALALIPDQQRTWVGLTDEDKKQIAKEANYNWEMTTGEYAERIGRLTEAKLKEKNT